MEVSLQSIELLKSQLPLDQNLFEFHLNVLFNEETSITLCPGVAKLLMNTSAKGKKYDLNSCDEFVKYFCSTTKRDVSELSKEEAANFQRYLWQFFSNLLVDRPTLQTASWNNEAFM
jgi:hypothetical protein